MNYRMSNGKDVYLAYIYIVFEVHNPPSSISSLAFLVKSPPFKKYFQPCIKDQPPPGKIFF